MRNLKNFQTNIFLEKKKYIKIYSGVLKLDYWTLADLRKPDVYQGNRSTAIGRLFRGILRLRTASEKFLQKGWRSNLEVCLKTTLSFVLFLCLPPPLYLHLLPPKFPPLFSVAVTRDSFPLSFCSTPFWSLVFLSFSSLFLPFFPLPFSLLILSFFSPAFPLCLLPRPYFYKIASFAFLKRRFFRIILNSVLFSLLTSSFPS